MVRTKMKMTHQELLNSYVNTRLGVIHERSGDLRHDYVELLLSVESYAIENGLNASLNQLRELIADTEESA